MARYPETPTQNERDSLHDFMLLFSRMYPCGECARHFNKLITQYPPQTSSRSAASQWLCAMHNKVNERLEKPIFDCNNIESKYPCGCAEETLSKRLCDAENNIYDSPRKKFISEESFARDMEAMSLYSDDGSKNINNAIDKSQVQPRQNSFTVRIDDINQFLNENQDEANEYMPITADHKTWIDDGSSGLILELYPGEKKPRVPSFVLRNSGFIDHRDNIALTEMAKSNVSKLPLNIEIINPPTNYTSPTAMDLD